MRAAIIIAAVVLATASSTGAALSLVITSKDIKNGTIRRVDLSGDVRNALTRQPRPSLRVQRVNEGGAVGSVPRTIDVACPPGTRLTGGGFSRSDVDGPVDILASHPHSALEAWEVTAVLRGGGIFGGFTAYALCASLQ